MAESDVSDLVGFLSSPRDDLRRPALQLLLPFTAASSPRRLLLQSKPTVARLAALARADDPTEAHDAVKALINLAESEAVRRQLNAEEGFLRWMMQRISDPTCVIADPLTMLLSNLTKDVSCSSALLGLSSDAVALLADIFARGEGRHANPNASFDSLASVLANLSVTAPGRTALLRPDASDRPLESPIVKMAAFTEHPSLIRRGGVISSLKNCCFAHEAIDYLLDPDRANVLPRLLLPLCGSEQFDADDLLSLPDELAALPPSKQRESDPALRLMLVEALQLLCASPSGRRRLRDANAYRVVQMAHAAEKDERILHAIERLVNVLQGSEPGWAPPSAVAAADDELAITEM